MTMSQFPDLPRRRHALGALGALSAAPLVGLASTDAEAAWSEQFSAQDFAAARSCVLIPQETQGPYPLLSILDDPNMVRRDVTEGRPGVALTLALKLVDVNKACAPLANAAVYIWHCDKDGVYSGYQQPGHDTRGQTFMRGVQLTNPSGQASFTTIFPGCYSGRYPHIHFEVYSSLGMASIGSNARLISQLALPRDACAAVYASATGYAASATALNGVTLAGDNVFGDNSAAQMAQMTAAVSGSVAAGYTGAITIGVAA